MAVYLDRKTGEITEETIYEFKKLNWLYTKPLGFLLRDHLVTKPAFSKRYGKRMRRPESVALIPDFIAANRINTDDFILKEWSCFTDFFIREPKTEARPWINDPYRLASPADARLSVVRIDHEGDFQLKGFTYTLAGLLGDAGAADGYAGGLALIFRLTVGDCHRYYYMDDCVIAAEPLRIPGRLHTVGPVADGRVAVLRENSRDVTYLATVHFARVAMIEVGALTIGGIVNHERLRASRGDEKGWFEPGASTIVLLFQTDRLEMDTDIMAAARQNTEVKVQIGEGIGSVPTRLYIRGEDFS